MKFSRKRIVLNTIIIHSLSNNSNKGLHRKAWHIIYAKAAESGGRMTRKGRITGKGCVEGTPWERVAAYRTVRPAVGAFPRGFHGDDAGKLVDPRCNNRDVESSCLTVVRPGILFIRCQVLQEGPSFVRGIVKSVVERMQKGWIICLMLIRLDMYVFKGVCSLLHA